MQVVVDDQGNVQKIQQLVEHVDQATKQGPAFVQSQHDAKDAASGFGGAMDGLVSTMGAYLSVGAIKGAIESTIQFGMELNRQSLQTGIALDKLQELNIASGEFGIATGTVANSVSMLSKRLAGDDASADRAMMQLGLSTKTLMAMSPDQMFVTVATALSEVSNKQREVYMGSELFGRSFREIMPMINDHLQETIDKTKDLNLEIDKTAMKSLVDAGIAWDHVGLKSKQVIAEMILDLQKWHESQVSPTGPKGEGVGPLGRMFGTPEYGIRNMLFGEGEAPPAYGPATPKSTTVDDTSAIAAVNKATSSSKSDEEIAAAYMLGLHKVAVVALTDVQEKYLVQLKEMNLLDEVHAKGALISIEQFKAYEAVQKELIKDGIEYERVMKELDAMAMTRNAFQVKDLELNEKAGRGNYGYEGQIAGLQALDAAEFALSKRLIDSLTSEKDIEKVREETTKRHIEIMNEEMAIEEKQLAQRNKMTVEEFNAKAQYQAAHGFDVTGDVAARPVTDLSVLYDSMDKLQHKQATGEDVTFQLKLAMDAFTNSGLDAAKAQDALNLSLGKVVPPLAAVGAAVRDTAASFRLMGGEVLAAGASTSIFYTDYASRQRAMMGNIGTPQVIAPYGPNLVPFGQRAGGGDVEAGMPYVVGEQRPELFVPNQSGRIVPRAGGGDTHVHVYAQGAMFQDRASMDKLADKVSIAMGRRAGIGF